MYRAIRSYIYATLNNTITPCNNSPVFQQAGSICLTAILYNHGGFDVDGDFCLFNVTPDSAGLSVAYLQHVSSFI
jgi:hypothetical protein